MRRFEANLNARHADYTRARYEGTHTAAAWAALRLALAELGAALGHESRVLRGHWGLLSLMVRKRRGREALGVLGVLVRRYTRRTA